MYQRRWFITDRFIFSLSWHLCKKRKYIGLGFNFSSSEYSDKSIHRALGFKIGPLMLEFQHKVEGKSIKEMTRDLEFYGI